MHDIALIDTATLAGVVALFVALILARRKAVRQMSELQREIANSTVATVMKAIRAAQTDPLALVAKEVESDLEWVYELGISVGASKCAHADHKAA